MYDCMSYFTLLISIVYIFVDQYVMHIIINKAMIDINTFRSRIGSFSPSRKSKAQEITIDQKDRIILETFKTNIADCCLFYIRFLPFTLL